jgi:EmrB/QacA subfamily drug resistance transporter
VSEPPTGIAGGGAQSRPAVLPPTEAEQTRYGWKVLSVTSLGVTLTFLNTSTLNVALPSVSRHFHASPTASSWFLLSYALVSTILILVFGRLADLLGRRPLYLIGMALLTFASLSCVFAPNAWTLVALRGVQGIGAAAVITNTTAQLVDAFPPRLVPVALGFNVTVSSAANVLGPILGGALVAGFGWRAVFWFNVPVGLVGIWWARRTLRPSPGSRSAGERFDSLGAVVSLVALSGLVIAISQGGSVGWGSPLVLWSFVVAALAVPAFALVESLVAHPLVDFGLFRDRQRSMAYLATFLMSISQASIVLLASLYLQSVRGLDSFHAGLGVSPMAVGLMAVAPVSGRLARRFPPRVLSSVGLAVTAAGLLLLGALLSTHTPLVVISGFLLLIGGGVALFATPNTSSLLASVRPDRRGIANGLRSMLQNTAQTLSVAMSLAITTSLLAAPQKKATYLGDVAGFSVADQQHLITGFRTTILVLTASCLCGLAVSLLRGTEPPPAPAEIEPDALAEAVAD